MPRRCQRLVCRQQQIAAANINVVVEYQGNGFARIGFFFIAIKSDDTRHAGFHARRQHFNALSDFDATRRQSAGIPPKIKIRAINVLYRKAHRLTVYRTLYVYRFQDFQQRRTAVPAHIRALRGDIIPFQRRKRDKANVQIARQLFSKGQVIFANTGEGLFAVVNEIHFVDCHHQVFDPQQSGDKAMATRLIQHAFTRVDQ
ncbi:Uncharacterised protein [Salmonella enterica subsp. enterica serovar Bovismorbificans]|uniref:Uncharacterized protein n=1 Tax=Salmonella enterica subsp. enterica serovar Bovismorbificans TaxID=58097 RepID=A0A655ESD8_SALET|nr:Uncharacterised protein [Salmonella enterica subsp. enterica serovar Bovismorbificans]